MRRRDGEWQQRIPGGGWRTCAVGNFAEKFLVEWGPPGRKGREGKLEWAGFASWVGPVDGFGP
jgi:hypothetical protein